MESKLSDASELTFDAFQWHGGKDEVEAAQAWLWLHGNYVSNVPPPHVEYVEYTTTPCLRVQLSSSTFRLLWPGDWIVCVPGSDAHFIYAKGRAITSMCEVSALKKDKP